MAEANAKETKAEEPKKSGEPNATPIEPSIGNGHEPDEQVNQASAYMQERGVDLTDKEVQKAVLEGAEADDLIQRFGTPEPEGQGEGAEAQAAGEGEAGTGEEGAAAGDGEGEGEGEAAAGEGEGEAAGEAEPERKKDGKVRFTPKSDEDRIILDMARAKNISLAEASRLYNGDGASSASQKAEPKPDPQAESLDQKISEADGQITDLQEKIKAAKEEADYDELFDLQEKLFDAKTESRDARREKEGYESNKAAQSQAEYDRGLAASSQRVAVNFPDLGKDGTMARQAFDAFINSHDPNDHVFDQTDWPEILSEKFADQHPEIRKSPAPSEDAKKVPAKTQKPAQATRRDTRSDMLDGGQGGPESPAPTDEGPKPPTMEEATRMYEEITADMTAAEKQKFDAEIYA